MIPRVIGSIARKVLTRNEDARLLGITSRGVFIHTDSDWVLFLSGEAHRGPLTINIDDMPGSFLEMASGDPIVIQADGLWFPKRGLRVSLEGAAEWSAPPRAGNVLSPPDISERLRAVAAQIRFESEVVSEAELVDLFHALRTRQAAPTASALSGFLGRGVGLTPAGDDLAAGLLLALNRWQDRFFSDFSVEGLNSLVTADARRKTTSLSASLIACAAQGQADERLVLGLDGLVTGSQDAAVCAACFNTWGSTSGANAFIGMRLALQAYSIG